MVQIIEIRAISPRRLFQSFLEGEFVLASTDTGAEENSDAGGCAKCDRQKNSRDHLRVALVLIQC
jgi:hypothetical protein